MATPVFCNYHVKLKKLIRSPKKLDAEKAECQAPRTPRMPRMPRTPRTPVGGKPRETTLDFL
jgi:hypothetical protein